MPKVLIVDDEEIIRTGLSQMVSRLLPEWEVVGACPDAPSAREAIGRLHPDLVVLDIGMPGESGLEAADKLARMNPDLAMIMLTGYDKFEHIQSAMRSGVIDYLLKPIQREELKQAILKAGDWIARRKREQELLLARALASCVAGGEEHGLPVLTDLLAKQGLLGSDMRYLLQLTLHVHGGDEGKASDQEARLARAATEADALGRAGAKIARWVVVPLARSCDLLFVAGAGLDPLSVPSCERQDGGILVCRGQPVAELAELPREFRLLQERLLLGIGSSEAEQIPERELQRLSKLAVALETNDLAGTVALLRRWLEDWRTAEPLRTLRGLLRLTSFFSSARTLPIESSLLKAMRPAIDALTGRLLFSYDPLSLLREAESFVERVALLDPATPEDRRVIGKVKEMIKREYVNPDFSLEQAAASVYLNPTYLSELFKESTGQKFIDYVTEVRLNEARRMLQETDMKMYEVCSAVGYTSSKYFSTLFRKRFNMTPTQYRDGIEYRNAEERG